MINSYKITNFRYVALFMLMLLVCSDSQASDSLDELVFAEANIISDDELGDIRGAYRAGGLDISFAISNLILVDNTPVIYNGGLDGSSRKLLSISDSGISISDLQSTGLPSFFTAIQNSSNNRVIQDLRIVDLKIGNFNRYKMQTFVPLLNYHSTQ